MKRKTIIILLVIVVLISSFLIYDNYSLRKENKAIKASIFLNEYHSQMVKLIGVLDYLGEVKVDSDLNNKKINNIILYHSSYFEMISKRIIPKDKNSMFMKDFNLRFKGLLKKLRNRLPYLNNKEIDLVYKGLEGLYKVMKEYSYTIETNKVTFSLEDKNRTLIIDKLKSINILLDELGK